MINELDVPDTDLRKYVDDTTISETISKNQDSHVQAAADTLASCATVDKFQLNETKCKELFINFNTEDPNRDFKIWYGEAVVRRQIVKITSGDVMTRDPLRLSRRSLAFYYGKVTSLTYSSLREY